MRGLGSLRSLFIGRINPVELSQQARPGERRALPDGHGLYLRLDEAQDRLRYPDQSPARLCQDLNLTSTLQKKHRQESFCRRAAHSQQSVVAQNQVALIA